MQLAVKLHPPALGRDLKERGRRIHEWLVLNWVVKKGGHLLCLAWQGKFIDERICGWAWRQLVVVRK